MKKLAYIISLIGLVFLLQNCKPEEVQQATTSIILTVTADKSGGGTTKISGAQVFLFRSESDYSRFLNSNGTLNNYVQKGTTDSEGKFSFCNLEADTVEYFFYAQKGNLNNDSSQYRMGGELYKNAAHYVTIKLTGFATKRIVIYSNDQSIQGNEIKIYLTKNGTPLDETLRHTLSSVRNANDTISNAGSFVFAPENGSYSLYIKNKNGCIWTEQITVGDDTEKAIELAACNTQEFKFYSSNLSGGNIKVYLNNELTPIGTINATGIANSISAFRPSSTYTYKAVHSNGTCTWIGSISNTNTPIDLTGCK